MNSPEIEMAVSPTATDAAPELICRCDWQETMCEFVRECGGCTHNEPRFRTSYEIGAADTKRTNSLLPAILKLAPEASGKIP